MIFVVQKQRTNAKSGRTKVADWQDVGVDKSTQWSLSNWERSGRNLSYFEDRFCVKSCYSSIAILLVHAAKLESRFPLITETTSSIDHTQHMMNVKCDSLRRTPPTGVQFAINDICAPVMKCVIRKPPVAKIDWFAQCITLLGVSCQVTIRTRQMSCQIYCDIRKCGPR